MKKFILSTILILTMSFLFGCSKEVVEEETVIEHNGEKIKVMYTGTLKGDKAEGKGKFERLNGENKYKYEGYFQEGKVAKEGKLSNYATKIKIGKNEYSGIYDGSCIDGKANGKGKFVSDDSKCIYDGEWKEGKINGEGYLECSNFVVHFKENDREGKYKGDVKNGTSEGKGTFSAKNSDGVKYTYDGEWKDGLFEGQGIMKYDDKNHYTLKGTFKKGEFEPTVKEYFKSVGTYKDEEYGLSSKSELFLDNNEKLFKGKITKDIVNKAKKLVDNKLTFNKYKSKPSKYGNKLMKIKGYVGQVINGESDIGNITMVIISDDNDNIYNIEFAREMENIKEGKTITLYGLPLAYHTYTNTKNQAIWAIKIAGVCVE